MKYIKHVNECNLARNYADQVFFIPSDDGTQLYQEYICKVLRISTKFFPWLGPLRGVNFDPITVFHFALIYGIKRTRRPC